MEEGKHACLKVFWVAISKQYLKRVAGFPSSYLNPSCILSLKSIRKHLRENLSNSNN